MKKLMTVVVSALCAAMGVQAKTTDVTPADDLVAIATAAESGDVIQLAADGIVTFTSALVPPHIALIAYIDRYVSVSIDNHSTSWGLIAQVRADATAEWQDVTFAKRTGQGKGGVCYSLATNYVGTLQFRFAQFNDDGSSGFTEPQDVTATASIKGELIGSFTQFSDSAFNHVCYAFDGDLGMPSDTKWIGLDFGRKVPVGKIRVVMRFDGDNAYRWGNGVFEVASDREFTDPVQVASMSSVASKWPCNRVIEFALENPVDTQFIRFIVPGNNNSVVSLEFIPAAENERPDLLVTPANRDDFKARCAWDLNHSLHASKSVLQRSIHPNKGWRKVAEFGAGNRHEFIDETLYVGLKYYYRVVATLDSEGNVGREVTSLPIPYIRYRRLERASATSNVLSDGVTLLNNEYFPSEKMVNAFDGNLTTFPDYTGLGLGSGMSAVGVDFGEKVHLGAFSYVARPGQVGRLQNVRLYGSNSEDWYGDRIQIGTNDMPGDENYTIFYRELPKVPADCQQAFLYGTWFYSNVPELGYFGWTDADAEYARRKETPGLMLILR